MTRKVWNRIEPHTRATSLVEGLQARVADPVWFLARQWQTGEFRGEDAASPVSARIEVNSVAIEGLQNEAGKTPKVAAVKRQPLEAIAEAEEVYSGLETDGDERVFRRARLTTWGEDPTRPGGARGTILKPGEPLRIYEEELPRGGLVVTRQWQSARGADGKLYVWMAREKKPGRGEAGSGLAFDVLETE